MEDNNQNTIEFEMSYFEKPISNKTPKQVVIPFWVYQQVKSYQWRSETLELRAMVRDVPPQGADAGKWLKERQRQYKGSHLDYVTPSGVFSYCNDASLIKHSGLLCIDLDDICPVSEVNPVFYDLTPECYNMASSETDAVEELKHRLIDDPRFNTVMAFRSPRGNGLKWWLQIDLSVCDHRTWFQGVRNFLMHSDYRLSDHQVDKMCANPSRACFLSHDPRVYLRTDLIDNFCI